jgi:hypothetical protein
MRQVVATIDGRLRQAGHRYTLNNQAPRPAAVASEMGQFRTIALHKKFGETLRAGWLRAKARHDSVC